MKQHTLILPGGTGYFETDKFPIGGSFHRANADMVIKVKEAIESYRGCDTLGITGEGKGIAFNSQHCKQRQPNGVDNSIQWDGDNWAKVWEFINDSRGNMVSYGRTGNNLDTITIKTTKDDILVPIGDTITRDINGDFSSIKATQ